MTLMTYCERAWCASRSLARPIPSGRLAGPIQNHLSSCYCLRTKLSRTRIAQTAAATATEIHLPAKWFRLARAPNYVQGRLAQRARGSVCLEPSKPGHLGVRAPASTRREWRRASRATEHQTPVLDQVRRRRPSACVKGPFALAHFHISPAPGLPLLRPKKGQKSPLETKAAHPWS